MRCWLNFTETLTTEVTGAPLQPAKCIGTIPTVISGRPDPEHISTSFIERLNWTTRTSMRRYTRLSNGFSRKLENHMAAVAMNYFAYNFIRFTPRFA